MKDIKVDDPMIYGYIPSKLDGTEEIFTIDSKLEIPEEYSWQEVLPPVRDQGNTQTCVCQSLTCILDFIKNSEDDTPGECNNFSINTLYNMRSNKPQEGMSIKEGLEIIKNVGLNNMKINSYAMVPSVEACKLAVMMFGPVVVGSFVYNSDITEFWKKMGNSMGGHAYIISGWTKTHFIIRNSWGKSYGKNGYAKMSFKDFEKYILEAWTATI